MAKSKYGKPEDYISEENMELYKEYSKNLASNLELIGASQEVRDELYGTIMIYEKNYLAANSLKDEFNELNKDLLKYKDLYEKEPNDQKAQEYLNKVHLILAKQADLKEKIGYFSQKADSLSDKVTEMSNYINRKINELDEDMDRVHAPTKGPTTTSKNNEKKGR